MKTIKISLISLTFILSFLCSAKIALSQCEPYWLLTPVSDCSTEEMSFTLIPNTFFTQSYGATTWTISPGTWTGIPTGGTLYYTLPFGLLDGSGNEDPISYTITATVYTPSPVVYTFCVDLGEEAFDLQADYDCVVGVAEFVLLPDATLESDTEWNINPFPGPNPSDIPPGSVLDFGMSFPGLFTMQGIESFGTFPYTITHTYCVEFGECPDPIEVFVVNDATCGEDDGIVCYDGDVLHDDGDPELTCSSGCGDSPSNDCITELFPGSYYVDATWEDPYDSNELTYSNLFVEIGGTALDVSITGPSTFCGGEFTSTITGGSSPYTYQWSFPSWMYNLSANTTSSTIELNNGYGLISLTVIDDNECEETSLFLYAGSTCAANLSDCNEYDDCPGEEDPCVDGNTFVNVADLLIYMSAWATNYTTWDDTNDFGCADFSGDGYVNVPDLLVFMGAFGSYDCDYLYPQFIENSDGCD